MAHQDLQVIQAAEDKPDPSDCRDSQVRLAALETQDQWDLQDLMAHLEGRETQVQLDSQVSVVTPALQVQMGLRGLQVSRELCLVHTVF